MNAKKKRKFSRRKFLIRSSIGMAVIVGGGLFAVAPARRGIAKFADEADLEYDNDLEPQFWFEVKADNSMILHSPKVEMGQGTFTGLAQIVADEIEVDFKAIQVVNATTNGRPVDSFSTGGSNSISGLWEPLRELAAQMREMLRNSAANILQVPATDLSISNGVITGKGKKITYGEVVQKTKKWEVPDEVKLKTNREYKYIGKPLPRIDLKPKVIGDPMFGIDVSMPGMLYGAVVRPDKLDVTFEGADISKAEKMPGVVKVVLEKDFVGVVAKSYTEAHNAKKAIKAKWKVNKVWQQKDIEDMIKVGKGDPILIQKSGSAIDDDEPGVITATFKSPIGAHAQIEPNGCVAFVEKDKATIKLSTQVVKMTRDMIAKRVGLDEDKVEVQAAYLGGGFGRRLFSPHAVFAAVLSKAVGKPVHMTYDRKEEFQNDTFRPPTEHLLKGKLTKQGTIEAIEHNVSSGDVAFGSPLMPSYIKLVAGADFGAWRGGMIQYKKIPNIRTTSWRVKLPFATSWWRSLGLLANTFAIESFIDELATKAGQDPVKFRLAMTEDDERGRKLKGVMEAAAKKANWGKKMPKGRAQGFAASTDANTPVAQIAEVSIEDNEIKVHKVTCAIDPGIAINPDSIKAQCEGAIIMGMSASMFEKMEVKDGEIGPIIYGPYQMALMRHAPKEIDTVILESGPKPSGVGEPPLGPIGAAIANAVFKLTGKRLRELPLKLS
ncbi:MAG TPA: xanthine dehydrogenase [Microscillaceae bacterium]|nr:xanthine dehydrogenase [Microscillaceae bacterium]